MSPAQGQDNEMVVMVVDALTRLLQEVWSSDPTASAATEQAFWQQVHEAGFLDVLLSAQEGGAEVPIPQLMPVLQAAGAHALSLPLMSTVLGRWWLAQHEALDRVSADDKIGFARGRFVDASPLILNEADLITPVDWLLVSVAAPRSNDEPLRETQVILLSGAALEPEQNTVTEGAIIDKKTVAAEDSTHILAALGQSALLTGAAQHAMELTLDYARQRTQFGRSIGRFQAIQGQASEMAEQFFAMDMATRLAFSGWEDRSVRCSRVAMAKLVSSEAAFKIATAAHAVHGAIGMTQEYELQRFTRLLYQWRRACGAEGYWAGILGAEALNAPQEQASALDFILARLA